MELLRRVSFFLTRGAGGIIELLRELGDQNAYARHLVACGREHSGAEWRRFTDERFRAKYQRPKCC